MRKTLFICINAKHFIFVVNAIKCQRETGTLCMLYPSITLCCWCFAIQRCAFQVNSTSHFFLWFDYYFISGFSFLLLFRFWLHLPHKKNSFSCYSGCNFMFGLLWCHSEYNFSENRKFVNGRMKQDWRSFTSVQMCM